MIAQEETNSKKIKQQAFEKELFQNDQMQIIEYFADNRQNIIDLICKQLAPNWTWARIPQVDKAILITAYAEFSALQIDRKIIIDQAIITTKHFSEPNSVAYINAILDKIIR